MNRNLLILGAGQYGKIVKETAEAMSCFWKIDFLDDENEIAIGKIAELASFIKEYHFAFVAVGNSDVREKLLQKAEECLYEIPVLVHPRAYVSPSASLLPGSIIEPMAVVQAESTIGRGTYISAGAVVNHNCFIGDMCHINVGAIISSNRIVQMHTKIDADS